VGQIGDEGGGGGREMMEEKKGGGEEEGIKVEDAALPSTSSLAS
jgi:hypothetical protein